MGRQCTLADETAEVQRVLPPDFCLADELEVLGNHVDEQLDHVADLGAISELEHLLLHPFHLLLVIRLRWQQLITLIRQDDHTAPIFSPFIFIR